MAFWNVDSLDDAFWPVRALRATPPGMADSGRRGKVFQAALEQFEQLLRANGSIGAASSPILLYYALSQAGRAILAAHGPNGAWDVHGHGLSVDTRRDPIGKTTIKPQHSGLFPNVAKVTGSAALSDPVTLSEAWGATPTVIRARGLGNDVPPLFRVDDRGGAVPTIRSESGGPIKFDEFWKRQELYPGVSGAALQDIGFPGADYEGFAVFEVRSFLDEEAERLFYGSLVPFAGSRYLRVPLGPSGDQPSGFMTLWVVLIGLSSLARYEPAGWTAALAPTCELAAPIERTLTRATLLIPSLVCDALAAAPP